MKDDSRKVEVGDTFISLTNNVDYIKDAIKNGAKKVIVEDGLYEVDTLIVKNPREYLIEYLDNKYKDIFKKIKIIGITGTNGKTTSCYLLWQILNKLGYKCGYIGTIGYYIEDKITDLNNTTPDILDLYNMINRCIDEKCKYIVMEVSSHSLALNRIGKLHFDYGVFTNLTKDHLDYHKNMHNYALAKQLLFKKCDISIINNDDINKHYFLINNYITYGFNDSNYKISDYNIKDDMILFSVNNNEYRTNIIGKYNIHNLVISIIILEKENIKYDKNIFEVLTYPPGRLDTIIKDNNKYIVDYAHTPDAVLNVIKTVRELKPNKIITIVGCGGNRDKSKRSEMGLLACVESDFVIFTSDNPREEDENEIINGIIQKLDKNNYKIESNRKKAIVKGIQMINKNDILLVLGKGHETYQIIGKEKIPFDDKKIIIENI